jgi:hypothetical protein
MTHLIMWENILLVTSETMIVEKSIGMLTTYGFMSEQLTKMLTAGSRLIKTNEQLGSIKSQPTLEDKFG